MTVITIQRKLPYYLRKCLRPLKKPLSLTPSRLDHEIILTCLLPSSADGADADRRGTDVADADGEIADDAFSGGGVSWVWPVPARAARARAVLMPVGSITVARCGRQSSRGGRGRGGRGRGRRGRDLGDTFVFVPICAAAGEAGGKRTTAEVTYVLFSRISEQYYKWKLLRINYSN